MYVQKCAQKEEAQIAFHPRGLSANRFWSGICQSAQNPTWRLATLIKSRILFNLSRALKRVQKWCSKLDLKSAERDLAKKSTKTRKSPCKCLVQVAPVRNIFLKFYTLPQISPMRAKRAPRPPITFPSIFLVFSIFAVYLNYIYFRRSLERESTECRVGHLKFGFFHPVSVDFRSISWIFVEFRRFWGISISHGRLLACLGCLSGRCIYRNRISNRLYLSDRSATSHIPGTRIRGGLSTNLYLAVANGSYT
jgi:hypothetical protein